MPNDAPKESSLSQSNVVRCYDLADAKAWLQEAIGNDGIGEYFTAPEKQAAQVVLDMMTDDHRPDSAKRKDEP